MSSGSATRVFGSREASQTRQKWRGELREAGRGAALHRTLVRRRRAPPSTATKMEGQAPRAHALTARATPARSIRPYKASPRRGERNRGALGYTIHTAISLRTIRIGATADPKTRAARSVFERDAATRV